ncbi:MAG: TraB/GumN family protein [Candidatus Omnitrophica bacterium]|nr:TraB/GumN family protein [Candidatus Omnitrophota bacterium]
MKKFFLVFLLVSALGLTARADTVYLKNGKSVSGNITERNNDYIKLDFGDVSITYWIDEIETIQQEGTESLEEAVTISSRKPSTREGNVFLWKAKSEKNIVYILGSIHLARPSLYPLDKRIEDAFSNSNTLVVEVNLEDFDQALLQQMFIERGMYSDGSTIRDHLSEETFKLVVDKMGNLGLGFAQMVIFKPWFLSITLATTELLRLGFDPEYGIDKHFLKKAKNKKILELESLEYQLNLFDGFSDEQQDLLLFSTLLDLSVMEKDMDGMVKAWVNGNAAKLEEILMQGLDEHPEILPIVNKIFYERNENMTVKIENYLDTNDTYFVVVGAGHLVGEKGIIQLLNKKGYSVQQL